MSVTSQRENKLAITDEDLFRLSVKQYHAMADACIHIEDDPVELLEGGAL